MTRRLLTGAVVAALVMAARGGCGGTDQEGGPGGSPSPSATQTLTPIQQAEAALLTSAEVPVPSPSDTVDIQAPFTAEGDQVSAPWPQFQLCSTVGKADEGPPTVVEPGTTAGAWAFGSAVTTTEDGLGYSQIDQYVIVYEDQAAAEAAVERSMALDCDEAIGQWADSSLEWTVETGPVPEAVSGFRTTGTFTHDDSTSDTVSTVMRSGALVHYLRVTESRGGRRDGLVDADYLDELLAAVADNLAG